MDSEPNNNKWYDTWATCRGVTAPVNTNTGTFSLPDIPLEVGTNELTVTVTDVSGNPSPRSVKKAMSYQ